MARKFENVSPFGELLFRGRKVDVGETVEAEGDVAERLAEQPVNWFEVVDAAAKKAPAKSE